MMYYYSFLAVSNDALQKAVLNSNCKQDCLGMTPLHILTCSSVHHDLNLYRMLIETHPKQLITKDKWGALGFGLSQWRDGITNMIATHSIDYRRLELYLTKIRSQLVHLEQEYFALKTSTTLLELALWKNKLNDEDGCREETTMTKLNKSSDFRQYCRVICGSDIVVECVLPFLIQVYS